MRNRFNKLNNNIKLAFSFTALQSLGRGIWMGNVLSLYIVLFSEKHSILGLTSNELLGLTAGITGIAMTAIVFPAGVLADKFKRDRILKVAGIIGIFSMIILIISQEIYFIILALFLWGAFQGLTRPAFESIVADSLETGNRSSIYSKIHLVRQFFLASGPVLNILLFIIFGDTWDINILRSVMLVGISISLISTFFLFFFKDKHSIGKESESLYENHDNKINIKFKKKIPILLVASNLIIGIGAGMTVKFFPVFFRAVYDLKPIPVQIIMGLTFLFTGIAGIIAQKFSKKKGRGEIILTVQILATVCLVIIGFYPSILLLIPLFIIRGSLMNSAQPLSRSILMDVIPKKHRGKWNSLEAIAWGLFWNASALFGGFIIGNNNFRLCFFITAGIYFLGTIPVIMLIPMVHKEKNT